MRSDLGGLAGLQIEETSGFVGTAPNDLAAILHDSQYTLKCAVSAAFHLPCSRCRTGRQLRDQTPPDPQTLQ